MVPPSRRAESQEGTDPDVPVFSSTKFRVMMVLKRQETSDLEGLSRRLQMSQMALYKHVRELESRGLVAHEVKKSGVGRPRLVFRATPASSGMFPKAYRGVALAAVKYIEDELGPESADRLLAEMQETAFEEYAKWIGVGTAGEKLKRLAPMRESDGYMAEVVAADGGLELVEHNCPISALAMTYPGVCEAERSMLARVLGTEVKAIHVDPGQTRACRFRVG